jgi:hypothetical protein
VSLYTAQGITIAAVGSRYEGALYVTTGTGCTVVAFPDTELYVVGDAVAPESFVAATMTIGPR